MLYNIITELYFGLRICPCTSVSPSLVEPCLQWLLENPFAAYLLHDGVDCGIHLPWLIVRLVSDSYILYGNLTFSKQTVCFSHCDLLNEFRLKTQSAERALQAQHLRWLLHFTIQIKNYRNCAEPSWWRQIAHRAEVLPLKGVLLFHCRLLLAQVWLSIWLHYRRFFLYNWIDRV